MRKPFGYQTAPVFPRPATQEWGALYYIHHPTLQGRIGAYSQRLKTKKRGHAIGQAPVKARNFTGFTLRPRDGGALGFGQHALDAPIYSSPTLQTRQIQAAWHISSRWWSQNIMFCRRISIIVAVNSLWLVWSPAGQTLNLPLRSPTAPNGLDFHLTSYTVKNERETGFTPSHAVQCARLAATLVPVTTTSPGHTAPTMSRRTIWPSGQDTNYFLTDHFSHSRNAWRTTGCTPAPPDGYETWTNATVKSLRQSIPPSFGHDHRAHLCQETFLVLTQRQQLPSACWLVSGDKKMSSSPLL